MLANRREACALSRSRPGPLEFLGVEYIDQDIELNKLLLNTVLTEIARLFKCKELMCQR